MYHYKTPAWKTRAVVHSANRMKRQSEKRPRPRPYVGYFIPPGHERNNAPKNRGRRLYLEQIP